MNDTSDDSDHNDPVSGWLDLQATSARVGAYVWLERQMFRILGGWMSTTATDARRIVLAEQSRERGELAAAWAEQLPAHVAADHAALTAAPSIEMERYVEGFEAATRSNDDAAFAALQQLIGAQLVQWRDHHGAARAVSDAPVIALLERSIERLTGHQRALDSVRGGEGASSAATADPLSVPSLIPAV